MNKTTFHRAIATLAFALLACVCWVAAGLVSDRMVQQELAASMHVEQQMAASIVDNTAQIIASDLAMSRAIPATIAEMDMIQLALAQSHTSASETAATEAERRTRWLAVPALTRIGNFLRNARGFTGLDYVWVVNGDGFCVASSNGIDPSSFVGVDMRARGYIQKALLGAFNETYGVGRTNGDPGIFIATPVYRDGFLVGAVIAKVSVDRLRHWVARAGTFVTDNNGVIVMAHESQLENRVMPDSPVLRMSRAERLDAYRRVDFRTFRITNIGERVRMDAPWLPPALSHAFFAADDSTAPSLYDERTGLNSGLAAHIVHPLPNWAEIVSNQRRDRLLVFITALGVSLLAIVIAVSYLRERRLHRATRHLADQLQSANTLLSAEARHDALTGALSRRYFLDTLRREVDLARSAGVPMSVAIADLDHFKQINDRFGHATGDRALEHFVRMCEEQLRASDGVGRLGGEEFGLLLPQTALADAHTVLERLRKCFNQEHCAYLPDDTTLSVSIGITELSDGDTAENLLKRADLALYAAKSGGRDRTEVHPADSKPPVPRHPETA
ncbi:sensor domain-containing diguanylate cyclase [Caballeronia mineralivorans]|jgi:diguanylate cyclase (GGDEF)-like protein|uniref:sensor domain-containing diguanylate cyclase n=2 Tax=Caballeronia mineralivorans TaxID=2010198 RepID=UPI0023F528E6|nr:sensor domain-containing diguanylate cyclase [Caballeronia mineralivorans]MDB5783535.1 diguanylate cyclase [Caballeronia mineralivorans]